MDKITILSMTLKPRFAEGVVDHKRAARHHAEAEIAIPQEWGTDKVHIRLSPLRVERLADLFQELVAEEFTSSLSRNDDDFIGKDNVVLKLPPHITAKALIDAYNDPSPSAIDKLGLPEGMNFADAMKAVGQRLAAEQPEPPFETEGRTE